jgi:hypothetical protein
MHGAMRSVHRIMAGNPRGKRPLRRPRHRREDNFKIDLAELGLGVWIGFIWLRMGTGDKLL